MIKIKMSKALEMKEPLKKIVRMKMALPIKAAYFFTKVIKQLDEEYLFFENKQKELLELYAEKDKEGKPKEVKSGIAIQKEHIEDFERDFNELLNLDIELNVEPYDIETLTIPITIDDMMVLGVLFEKEKENEGDR